MLWSLINKGSVRRGEVGTEAFGKELQLEFKGVLSAFPELRLETEGVRLRLALSGQTGRDSTHSESERLVCDGLESELLPRWSGIRYYYGW